MEREILLPYSQEPATGLSWPTSQLFLQDPF